ncbi:MAG: hypothetical protein COW02_11960 [Comamonadaceae bacterium CG12_big_fil_rev_8_21_14_0_65_59_15]|nr:MAG: hypothetical protein COW02_11960 [Comamonadaceae bacterium CG12_big_fil_rev_8_21_14_0_65_59_15]
MNKLSDPQRVIALLQSQLAELRIEIQALQQDRGALIDLSEDYSNALKRTKQAQEELDAHNEELIESRDSFRELQKSFEKIFRAAPFAYLMLDESGKITECNHLAANFFKHDLNYLLHKPLSRFVAKADHATLLSFLREMEESMLDDLPCSIELTLFQANVLPERRVMLQGGAEQSQGKMIYRIALIDLTHIDVIRADLLRSHRVLDQMREGVIITDPSGKIERVNQAFCEISGYIAEEAIGKTPHLLSSGKHDQKFYAAMWKSIIEKGWWHGEIWNRRKNGELYLEWLLISTIYDEAGQVENFVAVFSDVTARQNAQLELARLAHYDELTGLPNRTLGFDRLNQMVQIARRENKNIAVLFMDLDRFKAVNDNHGHKAGDQVLKEAAQRFTRCLRTSDSVVRVGGDEFLVLLNQVASEQDILSVAEKIITAVSEPFHLNAEVSYQIGTSIGAAIYPNDGADAETLVRHSDIAMYRAKKAGKNQLVLFNEPLQVEIKRKNTLEQSLRRAIEQREFFMAYQPKVSLADQSVVGLEALVRWRIADGSMIPPDQFIPVAEECGLIGKLSKLILEMVCRDRQSFIQQGLKLPKLAFNLSVHDFQAPHLADNILAVMRQFDCDPHHFAVEITESVAILKLADVAAQLQTLKQIGLQVHIDDFGTGYSSLSYLKHLPADLVKIDQSFVRELATDPRNRVLVEATLLLAHSLNLTVVAEGVETEEELAMLKEMGCEQGQGYLFAKPLPMAQLIEYLKG